MLTASDPDGSNNLSFAVEGLPQGAMFKDNGNGTAMVSWTPAAGDAGDYKVNCKVMDDGTPMESDSETIMLSVKSKAVGDTEVYIHKALASLRKKWLGVKGKHQSVGADVVISDADSGYVFDKTVVRRNGKWRYRGSYGDTQLCRVRVEIEGQYAEKDVVFRPKRMTPTYCGGGYDVPVKDDDHDKDDDVKEKKERNKDKRKKDD